MARVVEMCRSASAKYMWEIRNERFALKVERLGLSYGNHIDIVLNLSDETETTEAR